MRDPNLVFLQRDIELLHDKNQLMPRLRTLFREMDDGAFIDNMGELGIPEDFGIELMVQIALHRRTDPLTMIGLMRRFFTSAPETAAAIEFCVEHGVLDWDAGRNQLIVGFPIPENVQAELDLYQFVPPMIVEPDPVTHNKETGLLMAKGSIILKNNHHNGDVCLDHINRINKIPLSLNMGTARMIQNSWKNLDRRQKNETYASWNKRVKAFAKYDRVARAVLDTLVDLGNKFWMTHRYDKRGRSYCQGYHVTYQGDDWNKAIIELADKELLA